MKVYHYDSNGLYLGESDARMSPLEPNVPLVPANATLSAPPTPGEHKVCKFVAGGWTVVDDPEWIKSEQERVAAEQAEAARVAEEAEQKRFCIFFRNVAGKDTRVMFGLPKTAAIPAGETVPFYMNKPMTDPANVNIGYHIFETAPAGWDAKDVRGVPEKKIVNGAVVDRTLADMDKDFALRAYYDQKAEKDIKQAMIDGTGQVADDTTHLMISQRALDVLLDRSLHTAEEVAEAEQIRATYRSIYATVQNIRTVRDAAIAALDPAI